ncbi:TetR/AcrR family transcriptional regulator [Lentzea sp. BCCO 10_0856]|uniref:TetR/AcrR family transcriptional regulator n=1 Tax=Lentzea miocenica TaxID=3095431 RepID=A0ABU4SSZ6_9PSEU|nr:TetR/AcrR family transcriptional regulator [Lentzea sp. BCCO 10_0856]MDX8029027.1 TetR/AcrR family transcriptional regulator [Lentzea sp. BCCO 10_0856]
MSFPPRYRAKSRVDLSGEESRAKAVAVATELFATAGFKGTSVAAVAAKTGLSQSGLLHHFPSKAALLAAVLEERDRQDGDFLTGTTAPPLGWAAFDSLTALAARNSTRPHLVGLFVRLAAEAVEPSHPAHTWVQQHYAGIRGWLTEAVQAGKDRGEIAADAPVGTVVRTTIAVIDGLQQQWLLQPGEVSMTADFEAFVGTLRARWSIVGSG